MIILNLEMFMKRLEIILYKHLRINLIKLLKILLKEINYKKKKIVIIKRSFNIKTQVN
jgi:hypothetical protein